MLLKIIYRLSQDMTYKFALTDQGMYVVHPSFEKEFRTLFDAVYEKVQDVHKISYIDMIQWGKKGIK